MIVNKFPFYSAGGSHIYGVSWDGTSTTFWTRTDASANFPDPVPYVAGATNYGSPFDILYPWKDMTIVNDSAAGTMVKIPKFWYKLTQNGAGMSIQISDTAQTGYSVCPACMDRGDGKGERDYILVGRYHCASDYKSKTGVKPVASKTRSAFRTGIQGLGTGVYMMDWATWFTIWLLYLVEYANWNSQAIIGYGCGNSVMQNMGYTDSMPYHTGTTQSSRSTKDMGVQYRYIEGLWDNVRDWIDGCLYYSLGFVVFLNPLYFTDSTAYNPNIRLAAPYLSIGYPKEFTCRNNSDTFPIFIPTTGGGNGSTYSCDYVDVSNSKPCWCVGGDNRPYDNYGLFCISAYATTGSNSYIGSRPMKLP